MIFFRNFFRTFTIAKIDFFDFHYILYKFLYSLIVKNSKSGEKSPFFEKRNCFQKKSLKSPKTDRFLFRLIPFDQNRRFWKDLKTAKNSLFDLIREFSKCSKILVSDKNQQSAPKIHQFWDFLWNFFSK